VIFVPKIYVGSKKPNKTRFEVVFFGFFRRLFLGFIGWVFLGGFFIANPAQARTWPEGSQQIWR
jgi:hypothetical protein